MQPWRELARWPGWSRLVPRSPVRVRLPDGQVCVWAGDRQLPVDRSSRFTAVALAADDQLERRLVLPALPEADLRQAMELDVRSASPFDPSDLAWGWRQDMLAAGQVACTAVLARRSLVQQRVESARDGAAGPLPEAWAFTGAGRPVVLEGFGEATRLRSQRRRRTSAVVLLVLILLLGAAAAVTPTIQLKLRALQAASAYGDLERQLGPALAEREALLKAQSQHEALRSAMADRVEPLAVMDLLTQAVPDDTWIQRLQLQGSKLTLSGQTPNTATLMNKLSGVPQVRDVKAPAPATRANAGRENFTVELTLLPAALRPAAAASGARP